MTNTSFSQLGLSPSLLQSIEEQGFDAPTAIQEQVIPLIASGQDLIGLSQTGSGKTAAFLLPLLEKIDEDNFHIQALIVTPTRELCTQISAEVEKFSQYLEGVGVAAIYGGSSLERQARAISKARIVVGTPGRLLDCMRRRILDVSSVKTLVLDEADRLLDMGFIEELEALLSALPDDRQSLFFSATMHKGIAKLIENFSKDAVSVRVKNQTKTVSKVIQKHYEVRPRSKVEALARLLDTHPMRLAIIFCNTKFSADSCTEALLNLGYKVDRLHGDLSQELRERTIRRFRQGDFQVLVATDVAARGLDIDEVDIVFNYDLPRDPEDYVHRIGRTGRAGREGLAVSFVFGKDHYKLSQIEKYIEQKIPVSTLPTLEEVESVREEVFFNEIAEKLSTEPDLRYISYIEKLQEEGHTAQDIASTLFGSLRDSLGRKSQAIREDSPEPSNRYERRKERPRRRDEPRQGGRRFSDREKPSFDRGNKKGSPPRSGYTKMFLSIGHQHAANPKQIVGMLYGECNLDKGSIGSIDIFGSFSLVEVPQKELSHICLALKKATYRGRSFIAREDREQ